MKDSKIELTNDELRGLLNVLAMRGIVIVGKFPSLAAVKRAKREGRLHAEETENFGFIEIDGQDECFVRFIKSVV